MITFWSNGEYIVLMLSGIGHLIIDDAIAINVILLGMMVSGSAFIPCPLS